MDNIYGRLAKFGSGIIKITNSYVLTAVPLCPFEPRMPLLPYKNSNKASYFGNLHKILHDRSLQLKKYLHVYHADLFFHVFRGGQDCPANNF